MINILKYFLITLCVVVVCQTIVTIIFAILVITETIYLYFKNKNK